MAFNRINLSSSRFKSGIESANSNEEPAAGSILGISGNRSPESAAKKENDFVKTDRGNKIKSPSQEVLL